MTKATEESTPSRFSGNALFATIARATPLSMLGHVVNVTLAVIAFQRNVEWVPLMLWAATSYGVGAWVLFRWATRRKRFKRLGTSPRSSAPRRAAIFGAVLSAPWGILGFWLLGDLPQQQELILIALCLGMSASGSVLLSATFPSAITYMTCILAPVALKCFVVLSSSEYHLLGALTLSYSLFLLNCIRSCAKLFADRNRAVDELRQSLLATENAKRDIERANNRFESALRNMPQGLSMFDGNDCLVAFNRQYLDIYGLSPDKISIGMKFHEVFAEQNLVPDLDEYLRDFKQRIAALEYTNNNVTFPDGRVIYVSYALSPDGGWVATHEDITQRKASERKIQLLAHFDGLTHLANRNLFKERLEEAIARYRRLRAGFAVMLLDLDKFKGVNDALGHHAGDALLQQVSDRIRATVREIDIPARLGGDEFGLIVALGQGQSGDAVAVLAERLIEAIGAPYEIDGHPVVIGCSIGIAMVPDHGERFDEVLGNADLALYKSKHSGRSCSHFYSQSMQAEADQRNKLEVELREAIWLDELDVHYQPIFDLKSGQVMVVEALVRWDHKTRGFIPPTEFIPVAEEAGLIVDLGKLVLRKAFHDVSKMPNHVKVAVNLSPIQFAKSDLVDTVITALAEAHLHESRLELEITEGVFLEDNAQNLKTLDRLRNLGVSIALDDFGVGYSSLSYLTAFPFDKVKIDKSFMNRFDRTETQTVMTSIVQLAKSLKLSVVAEGIETEAQLEKLRSLGIDFGQGYLLGRPTPAALLGFARYAADDHIQVGGTTRAVA
jgi:diguanylate cyclase (GGDEF)-like protein/PAS domain S-box-containing protein